MDKDSLWKCGLGIYNLGIGTGYSVQDIVNNFEKTARELGWKAENDIFDVCKDAWNWQIKKRMGIIK